MSKPAIFHNLHEVIGVHDLGNGRVSLVAYEIDGDMVTIGGDMTPMGAEVAASFLRSTLRTWEGA